MITRSIHTDMPTRRGRRGLLAIPICTSALLAGCTGSPPDPSPSPSGSIGAEIPVDDVTAMLPTNPEADLPDMDQAAWQQLRQDAASVPWKMVSAAGVEQAVACIGQGAPTVVYLDGWSSNAAVSWSQAAVAQSRSNRVCLYDRAGDGLSPARAGAAALPTSEDPMPGWAPVQHAREMLAMLQVLGEPGPYLVTGWSYGGLVARTAAAHHPEKVAGMVLVDATSPLQQPNDGDVGPIAAPSVGEGPDMGNRPVIVLQAERLGWWPAAGRPFVDAPEDRQKRRTDLQLQAATISDNSLHAVVDDSYHDIPIRHPAAVVAATTAVSESIRAGNATLPPCPDDLITAGGRCTEG